MGNSTFKKTKSVIGYLWKVLPAKMRFGMIMLYFASFLKAVSDLLVPLAMSVAIAKIQGDTYQIFGLTIDLNLSLTNLIIVLFATMFMFFIISIIMNTCIKMFGTKCNAYVNEYLSNFMLDDKMNTENYTNGELAYIIKSSSESASWYIELYFTRFLVLFFALLTSLAYIATLNLPAFSIVLISLLILCGVVAIRVIKNKKILQSLEFDNAKLNNNLLNDLKNISFIKFFDAKKYELALIRESNKSYYKTDRKKNLVYLFYWICSYVIEFACSLVAVLFIIQTLPQELMLAVIVLVIPYLMKIYSSIESMGFIFIQLQQHSMKVLRAEDIIKVSNEEENIIFTDKTDNNFNKIEKIKIKNLAWYKFSFSNITFYNKQINCLQGKNGSGKSSMIKCLLGLKDYESAEFIINGKYQVPNLLDFRKNIALSFQDEMFFDRPIVENIMYPKKQLSPKAKELVETFNLENVLKRKDKQNFFNTTFEANFSGGEKKKMSLIRALKDDKDIYIFDEPTNDLDSQSVDRFIKIIKELSKTKMIIIISHDKKILSISDNTINLVGK